MTPTAYTIPETLPVSRIAKTMIAGRLHRLLVTRGRHLIGIVTPFDMLKLLLQAE
jgi:CBS domain-containing protein